MEVLRDAKKMTMVYHRLLLAMSIGDVVLSFTLFLGSWPIPYETENVFMAFGNTATCSAQGFFLQLGIISQFYNAYLAVYYVLVIKYNKKERHLQKMEKFVHWITWLFSVATAIAGLVLNQYNSANLWCWIAPFPEDCDNVDMECTRGNKASFYRFAFFYAWVIPVLVVVMVCMCIVMYSVHQQQKRLKRYAGSSFNNLKQVAIQAMWYIVSFFLTTAFNSTTRIIQATTGKTHFPIILLMVIFFPLQGWWNFLIYLRPRYAAYRKKNPEWSFASAIRQSFRRGLFLCCRKNFTDEENEEEENDDDYLLGTIPQAVEKVDISSRRVNSSRRWSLWATDEIAVETVNKENVV